MYDRKKIIVAVNPGNFNFFIMMMASIDLQQSQVSVNGTETSISEFFISSRESVLFGEAQLLQMATEQLPVLFFLLDLETARITWASEPTKKYIKGPLAEFTSAETFFRQHVVPEDFAVFSLAADFLIQNPWEIFKGKFRIIDGENNLRSFAVVIKPLETPFSSDYTAMCMAMDITETIAPEESAAQADHLMLDKLTSREKQVLQLIVFGNNDKEIASQLYISPHTAMLHRKNLLKKMEVKNTASLVRVAMEEKIILR